MQLMKRVLLTCLIATTVLAETKVRNSITQGAPVNAVDKGADPTGVNDSQPGIQTCATAAAAVTGMCVVPAGTYKLNSNVVTTTAAIMVYQGAVFAGTGRILLTAGTPSTLLTIPSDIQINHLIWPVAPSLIDPAKYPLGSDFWDAVRGSADLRLQDWSYNVTSTTTVAPGAATITVGTGRACPSTATADPNCSTVVLPFSGTTNPTANFCTPAGSCALVVEQDGANEETITSGNWSVASATTLTATFAKAHTQPYNVRQIGAVYLDTRTIGINTLDVADRPITVIGRSGNILMKLPNDTSGTFPSSALQLNGVLTGMQGANSNMLFRFAKPASVWQVLNSANTGILFQLNESSGGAFLTLGNATNNPVKFDASASDAFRLSCGGTNTACLFYPNQTGAGTNGNFSFRNNATDNTEAFGIDTAAKTISMQALTFAGLGTPANGKFAYCSDCTIANPCAGAGTGALAKRLNGVWVCN